MLELQEQVYHIAERITAYNWKPPYQITRQAEGLKSILSHPKQPVESVHITKLLQLLDSIRLLQEPSGLPMEALMAIHQLVEKIERERRAGKESQFTQPALHGPQLVEAFREMLNSRLISETDGTMTLDLERDEQLLNHPRVKEIMLEDQRFESYRAQLAAVAVEPIYWKIMTVERMLNFCTRMKAQTKANGGPSQLKDEWDETRYKQIILQVCEDLEWTPDMAQFEWLRFPLMFDALKQAELISVMEYVISISSEHSPLYTRYVKEQTTTDHRAFSKAQEEWRQRLVSATRRHKHVSSWSWENNYHPYLSAWDGNSIPTNRLRLTYNGFGPIVHENWRRMWNQLISAPTAQICLDEQLNPDADKPQTAHLDARVAVQLTDADLDITGEPTVHHQDWDDDDNNEDMEDSRTTQLRDEAVALMNALPSEAQERIKPAYRKWCDGFPTQPFIEVAVQQAGAILPYIQDQDARDRLLEPQFQLFGMDGIPKKDDEWYRLFCTHSIQTPPTSRRAELEQHRLMGNLRDDFGF